MKILTPELWDAYSLLDSGNGKRLERFGEYTIVRPDPQCLWRPYLQQSEWYKADATFTEIKGRAKWQVRTTVPEKWLLQYKDLSFFVKLSPFKHTGVFPEQTLNWDWLEERISNFKFQKSKKKKKKEIKILNLFAYTGIASLVCAKAGAHVTHVDASKPTIGWAKENQAASQLEDI